MNNHKAILLNVPVDLLKRLNEAATAMEISRSELIRRALKRDVEFMLRQEVPELSKAKEKKLLDFTRWLSYNSNA